MTTVVNGLVQWDGVFVSDSLILSLLRVLVAIIFAEVIIFPPRGGGGGLKKVFYGGAPPQEKLFVAPPPPPGGETASVICSTRFLPILLGTCAAFCTRVRDRSSRGYPLPSDTQATLRFFLLEHIFN